MAIGGFFMHQGSENLELVLVASGNDDIVDLEHHATKLCGQEKLLSLGDEGVDDKVLSHVCNKVSNCRPVTLSIESLTIGAGLHAVNTQP